MASFSVVTNLASTEAQSNLMSTSNGLKMSIEQLSSGLRINHASDDAAGLAVANGYAAQEAVLTQGIQNANDGLSTLQLKDGTMSNIASLLDRLSTLAAQSASGNSSVDRTTLNDEFTSVLNEIDREAAVGTVDSSSAGSFSVFVSNDSTNGAVSGTLTGADTTTLGINSSTISDSGSAATAVAAIANAVKTLGAAQASVGALENRLTFAVSLAQSQLTNTQAAESRIRDANIAEASANMTKFNILQQSGIAALAQANQSSSAILTLLR